MSVAQQAKASRRKARQDKRYCTQKNGDVGKRAERLKRLVNAENARKMRKTAV